MTEEQKKLFEKLDQRSDLQAVLLMSAPMVVTMCSPMVMRVADFAFVSKLGTAAQAAIVPSQMMLWCYIAMGMGLVSAVNTFAAQALGRKQLSDCSAYAWQSVYMAVVLGIGGLGLYPLLPSVFAAFGHDLELQQLEVLYTQISVWAILPTLAAQSLGAFFNGVHRPGVTMIVAVEGNALNIFLNYTLIFGAFGFPKLGFAGAAIGTVIAAYYQFMRLTWSLLRPRFSSMFDSRRTWRPDWAKFRALCRVGGPQGMQWFSEVMVWALFSAWLIGRFGMVELAASNVAWQYIRISFLPMMGIGQALTSLVGRAIGQGNAQRAIKQARIAVGLTFAYIAVLSIVYVVARRPLIGLFTDDEAVIAVGMKVMLCLVVFQVFDVCGTVYYHALRGAGDTTWPMVVFVIGHWLVVIGGGYSIATLRPDLGCVGPWIMATVLISALGILMWYRWHCREWMKISLFDKTAVESSAAEEAPAAPAAPSVQHVDEVVA